MTIARAEGCPGHHLSLTVKIAEWTLKLAEHALFSSFGYEIIQNGLIISSVTKGPKGLFLESPETFSGPETPFVKFRPSYSVELVFSYVVGG